MVCERRDDSCPYHSNGMCNFEKAPKPKTIAIDLDGTILEYDGWKGHSHFGKPLPGAREALQKLKELGFVIIVWTRGDREKVARYLKEQGIPFDYINENPYQPPDSSNKIYADWQFSQVPFLFLPEFSDIEVLDKKLKVLFGQLLCPMKK